MELLSIIVSIIALLLSILVAIKQSHDAKSSDSVSAVLELFAEFRKPELVEARQTVIHKLSVDNYCPEVGLYGLPDEVKHSALSVSHFFDHVGVLVAHNLVNREAIIGWIGDSAIYCWDSLFPYIVAERKIRNAPYQEYFELLYEAIQKNPPSRIRAKFK